MHLQSESQGKKKTVESEGSRMDMSLYQRTIACQASSLAPVMSHPCYLTLLNPAKQAPLTPVYRDARKQRNFPKFAQVIEDSRAMYVCMFPCGHYSLLCCVIPIFTPSSLYCGLPTSSLCAKLSPCDTFYESQ